MADRLRVEINGDAALIVIKGSVGPELAVTVPANELRDMAWTCWFADNRYAAARAEREKANG